MNLRSLLWKITPNFNKQNIKVLSSYHPGLGDQLQFSTLPEEFFLQHGYETYLWSFSKFRNEEIEELVWQTNPFIKGKKIGYWDTGDTPKNIYKNLTDDHITNWEVIHGLQPKNIYPKIYLKPDIQKGMRDIFLVDFSGFSTKYDFKLLQKSLNIIIEKNPKIKFLSANFTKFKGIKSSHNFNDHLTIEKINIKSLIDYYNIMASVNGLVTLLNGASVLSSAVKKYNPDMESICLINQSVYDYHVNKNIYIFKNINYEII